MILPPTLPELRLSDRDRVLVFAPHPDDESIATGGLLLAARDAGAARRVVVLTDGDNNPWPQRWIEKRWRIDDGARARWGARRRAEAQAALDVLGVAPAERCFLGMPDTGLASLLMREPERLTERLSEQIKEFRPTHIALPALEDRHPDHSAAHIALTVALARVTEVTPQCLTYSVHGTASSAEARAIQLGGEQSQEKQRAILQHETQMRLSRGRFLGFARETESYQLLSSPPPRDDHPLHAHFASAGELRISVDLRSLRDAVGALHLLILIENPGMAGIRWRLPLAEAGTDTKVQDLLSGKTAFTTRWQRERAALVMVLPFSAESTMHLGFVKLVRNRPSLVIYDRYGWQRVDNPVAGFG